MMGSVSSLNPGLANLFQTLSNVNSPVLSSPSAVSALEKASPTDIAQLSMEATQLEGVDALFGVSDNSSDSSDTSNLLANLEATLTGSDAAASGFPQAATNSQAPSTTSSSESAANQAAGYQTAVQAAEAQALLGTGSTSDLPNSLFDVFA